MEELAKGVDGHPLALMLLVRLVKTGAEDILEDLSVYREHKEDTILKQGNSSINWQGVKKSYLSAFLSIVSPLE